MPFLRTSMLVVMTAGGGAFAVPLDIAVKTGILQVAAVSWFSFYSEAAFLVGTGKGA